MRWPGVELERAACSVTLEGVVPPSPRSFVLTLDLMDVRGYRQGKIKFKT